MSGTADKVKAHTVKRTFKVCNECPARYSLGSTAPQLHTRATGHSGWTRKVEIRLREGGAI